MKELYLRLLNAIPASDFLFINQGRTWELTARNKEQQMILYLEVGEEEADSMLAALSQMSQRKGADMSFLDYKNQLTRLFHKDTKYFIMALMSIEYGIDDEKILERVYNDWLNMEGADNNSFVSDEINQLILEEK